MKTIVLFLCCVSAYNDVVAQKDCPHTEYAERLIKDHPEVKGRIMAIEAFTTSKTHPVNIDAGGHKIVVFGTVSDAAPMPDVITIPVVVHVIYNNDGQNISDKLISSQIDALNKDFRKQTDDISKLPSYFTTLAADCGITFRLASTDPSGFATNGIVRKKTNNYSFNTDDAVKFSTRGGDDAWDASRYLNIWVCNLSGGTIGYSSIPGCPAPNDGVVIRSGSFGIGGNQGIYNRGRTATHEIGHWLNLRHIWGDAACGDDKVDDTPAQAGANKGCPSGQKITCSKSTFGDLYMNFMDLTNDECMYMFTNGQRDRMRTAFMPGGVRNSLLSSNGLAVSAIPQPGALPEPAAEISIYPNPVASTLNVRLNGCDASEERAFTIYNQFGQVIRKCIFSGKTSSLDISHFANGIYFLRSSDGSSVRTFKFVKAGG